MQVEISLNWQKIKLIAIFLQCNCNTTAEKNMEGISMLTFFQIFVFFFRCLKLVLKNPMNDLILIMIKTFVLQF